MIERKNKRRQKKTTNEEIEEQDSDHGTEVRGAGADKNKRKKWKDVTKSAAERKKSNASFDIIPTNNKENRNQSKKPKSKPTKCPKRKPLSNSSVANLLETISTPSRRINSNRNNNITTPVRRF